MDFIISIDPATSFQDDGRLLIRYTVGAVVAGRARQASSSVDVDFGATAGSIGSSIRAHLASQLLRRFGYVLQPSDRVRILGTISALII